MKHIELPESKGVARVSADIKPETVKALDEMMRVALKSTTAATPVDPKFPDGVAVYRGEVVRILSRANSGKNQGPMVNVRAMRGTRKAGRETFVVGLATLCTLEEYDKKMEARACENDL